MAKAKGLGHVGIGEYEHTAALSTSVDWPPVLLRYISGHIDNIRLTICALNFDGHYPMAV
jgi:hypothetical protein